MAGTRGMGRLAAMVVALAVVLMLVLADAARAGTYRVAQCGWGIGADLDATQPATQGTGFSLDPGGCLAAPWSGPVGMAFEGAVAPDGVKGIARARWVAPPGTRFTGAHVTWFGEPHPGSWQGLGVDVDARFHTLATAFESTPPERLDLPIEGGAWAFEAWLQCLIEGPQFGCTRSVPESMHLRELIFDLEDPVAPTAAIGGALAMPGWHRGTARLELSGSDAGSGVASGTATIDGTPAVALAPACATGVVEGAVLGTRMQPCPPTSSAAVDIDTTHLADGPHTVHACATDYAGGGGCAADATIEVDNSPPTASFVAGGEGQVAVALKDRWSGPASGTISVRRADTEAWTDLPTTFDGDGSGAATLTAPLPDLSAGTYLFRAVATDAAGNAGSAQRRVSGSPDEIRRQVATGQGDGEDGRAPAPRGGPHAIAHGRATRLNAHLASGGGGRTDGGATRSDATDRPRATDTRGSELTVNYGEAALVRGRLTDRRGAGVAGRPVVVVARAAAGAGQTPERRRVVTDGGGRFEMRLPPGTSRRVVVAFHGGGGFAPAPRRSLALRVRAAVSLAAAPPSLSTGESVALTGRVDPGAARIPKRGKLVTIQYLERASGDWRPALVARTDARGRFQLHYRFRYVSGLARIRLRATALPEAGWPYAEGSSAPVTVTVDGR